MYQLVIARSSPSECVKLACEILVGLSNVWPATMYSLLSANSVA